MSKVRFISLLVVLALALTMVGVVAAQDDLPGAGEGGNIIQGNTRGSGNLGPLAPLRCSGVDCSDPAGLMFPSLIDIDPDTQNYNPGVAGSLATGWEVSEDGLTYTFTLRDDMVWTNGEPVTANDVFFSWDFMQQGETVGLSSSYSQSAANIVSAEVIDDYTIALSFEQRNCDSLRDLSIPVQPASAYGYVIGEDFDWTTVVDHPMDTQPAVTAGVFKFSRTEPGTAVYLEADQNYPDAIDGFVRPASWIYLDVLDDVVLLERFLSFQPGEPNFNFEPDVNVFNQLRESEAQFFSSPGRLWHYVALNVADPANPQNGLDEDGNPIDQGKHPIFGDVRVRQALQHAVNIDEIINGPMDGNATPMVAGTIPTAWTIHPELERRAFDLEEADRLLTEAGWTDSDGDGVRECNGCETAEEGTLFEFDVINPGDVRNDVAVVLQDQWAEIGAVVNVQPLDFNTMYNDNMGAQVFDAAVAGWRGAFPFDPDQRSFFGAENDIASVDSYGFNFGSYYNPRIEELGEIIRFGSCDPEEIYEAALETQEIFYEEQPYIWLYAFDTGYAAAPNIANFAPKPLFGTWNIDTWAVVE